VIEGSFPEIVRRAKLRLLKMHYESRVGHLGGNLSAIDSLLTLQHRVMSPEDRFVLSKGHAAGALYITLWSAGLLEDSDLDTFHGNGTRLPGHPAPNFHASIPIATGSLGHGFPVAVGMALARRIRRRAGHVYCLASDGEWQAGSNWEALIFAAHRRLDNLTVLVDVNGLQGFGTTDEVASMSDLGARLSAFGVPVFQVDGHDPEAIVAALNREPAVAGPPRVLLLETIKGKGISFMENRVDWHYLPMTEELYAQALREVEQA